MPEQPKSRKQRPMRRKHIPQRTCIVCRETTAKRDLVRVVRGIDGRIEVDFTGKKPGRGAYICRTRECFEGALKRRSIEHALQTTILPDDREKLVEFVSTLSDSIKNEKPCE